MPLIEWQLCAFVCQNCINGTTIYRIDYIKFVNAQQAEQIYSLKNIKERVCKILSLLHRAFDLISLFISPTYALVNRSILMLSH